MTFSRRRKICAATTRQNGARLLVPCYDVLQVPESPRARCLAVELGCDETPLIAEARGRNRIGPTVVRDRIAGVNPFSPAAFSSATVLPFEATGRDPFTAVRELRAIETEHFPTHDAADFGTFASDLEMLVDAPRGLILALDAEQRAVGFCWLLPLNGAGEARILRGERDGGLTVEHVAHAAEDCTAVYMTSVAVRGPWRGQGIASRLLACGWRELDMFHPKCLLQTAWSACGAGLLKRYSPVRVGECEGHPIFRASWNALALRPAA